MCIRWNLHAAQRGAHLRVWRRLSVICPYCDHPMLLYRCISIRATEVKKQSHQRWCREYIEWHIFVMHKSIKCITERWKKICSVPVSRSSRAISWSWTTNIAGLWVQTAPACPNGYASSAQWRPHTPLCSSLPSKALLALITERGPGLN